FKLAILVPSFVASCSQEGSGAARFLRVLSASRPRRNQQHGARRSRRLTAKPPEASDCSGHSKRRTLKRPEGRAPPPGAVVPEFGGAVEMRPRTTPAVESACRIRRLALYELHEHPNASGVW